MQARRHRLCGSWSAGSFQEKKADTQTFSKIGLLLSSPGGYKRCQLEPSQDVLDCRVSSHLDATPSDRTHLCHLTSGRGSALMAFRCLVPPVCKNLRPVDRLSEETAGRVRDRKRARRAVWSNSWHAKPSCSRSSPRNCVGSSPILTARQGCPISSWPLVKVFSKGLTRRVRCSPISASRLRPG